MVLAASALLLRALWLTVSQRVPLRVVLAGRFTLLTLGLGAGALCVVAILIILFRPRRAAVSPVRLPSTAGTLRFALVVSVVAWLAFAATVYPFQRLWFEQGIGLAAGVWLAGLLIYTRTPHTGRGLRVLDIVAFSSCLALVLAEAGLRGWAQAFPSPLNARVAAAPRELIRRFQCQPGLEHIGFPCNSSGFYDEEASVWTRGHGGERIVIVGDSFNVGIVPHAWHYTTVCEELTGNAIYNMGVAGIGPAEYLALLLDEALPLQPDRVFISIFVGNDLDVADTAKASPYPRLRSWFERGEILLFVVPQRLSKISAERGRLSADQRVARVQGENSGLIAIDREASGRAFPWVHDPALEEPTLSKAAFEALEVRRALAACGPRPPALGLLFETLREAARAVGSAPLEVLLVPDEFQVEDELWTWVEGQANTAGMELERDRPQRLIRAFLEAEGIGYLDLLPVLRAVEPGPDGQRHLYHAFDTHFNARGNDVVARALADYLGTPR